MNELSPDELVSFQTKLWEIVASRIRLYTGGESSSVPELTAHRILASVCFTLGVDPHNVDSITVRHILDSDVHKLYADSLAELQLKVKELPKLWERVLLSTPLLESRALKDTLKSIENFCSHYNSFFFAQDITCDIDYPLAQPVPESLGGVHYVTEYLERLLLENTFVNCFDLKYCSRLLKQVHPEYKELIINLYEPIAANAIGLSLGEQRVTSLNVDENCRTLIIEKLKNLSMRTTEKTLIEAAYHVYEELEMLDTRSNDYLTELAHNLSPRVHAGVARESLEGVFLSF